VIMEKNNKKEDRTVENRIARGYQDRMMRNSGKTTIETRKKEINHGPQA
jgi:hypothetical protein